MGGTGKLLVPLNVSGLFGDDWTEELMSCDVSGVGCMSVFIRMEATGVDQVS